ncbi:MAG: hypothetical protein ABEJ92_06730 [Halobacteriales archaeon]
MSGLRSLLAVLLVVLAGCIGAPSPPGTVDGTPTGTDAPSATAPRAASPTVPNGTLAPGVTDEGLRNASRLLDAHARALRERGYELAIERRFRSDDRERTVAYRLAATPGLGRFRQRARSTVGGNETVHRFWLNATMERMLVRVGSDSGPQYRIPPVGPAGSAARAHWQRRLVQTRQLAELLRGGEFAVTGVNETATGRRYTLVGHDFATDGYYGEREVHLTVDGDGVVHVLKAAGDLAGGGSFSVGYRVLRLGVETVDRPDWVAAAPAPIDARPTLGFENCTTPYLAIQNPGPDTIPAGTVIDVKFDGTEHRVSLDAPLSAGGQRALYLTASGSLRVAAVDAVPPSRAGMPNEVEFTVTTGDGMLLSAGGIGFGCETAGEGGGEGSSASGSGSTGG